MLAGRERANPKAMEWKASHGATAFAGDFAEAASWADLIILAVLGQAAESAVKMAGPSNLAGKIVIDATNPLAFEPNQLPRLYVGHTDSLGEQVQRWAPEAKVVKAFNTVGNALMIDPQIPGGPPDMFLCGNDDAAKTRVNEICRDFGWGIIDIGGIEGSRLLEPMCMVWVLHGIRTNTWKHAFKMLHA